MKSKILIGLPAFNEENNINKLLDKIILLKKDLGEFLYVIVINDGSTDNTETILKSYSQKYNFITYKNHTSNMGLGCAVKTLFEYTVNSFESNDILVILDADNTHNPKIILPMINKLNKEKLDIVIASRFINGGKEIGLNFIRKFYSRGAKIFCKIVFPIRNANDYSCGYRAYNIGYIKKLLYAYKDNLITSSGFECMVEILAKSGKLGVRVGEYPLVLEYNLKEGKSKMNSLKTIAGYLRLACTINKSVIREDI